MIDGLPAGTVALCTSRARDGEPVAGALTLAAWEGLVLSAAERSAGRVAPL